MVQRVSDFNWPTRVEKSFLFLFYLFQIIKLCQIAIIAPFKGLDDIFSKMPLSSTNNTLLDKNDLANFLVAPQNFFFPHVIG